MLSAKFYSPAVVQPRLLTYVPATSKSNRKSPRRIPISKLHTPTYKLHGILRCSSSTASTPSELDLEAERSKVKEQLVDTIAASNGLIDEDSMLLVSCLEKLNPTPDITPFPNLYTGCFQSANGLFTSSPPKPGQALNIVTLGRATFNAFKPTDIKIQLKQTYNHVGIEAQDAYYLLIQFSVNGGAGDTLPLEGLLINKAKFSVASSTRFDITFESSTMVPLDPHKDLESWLKLFKDSNPTMDDKGSATIVLPPAKGFHDYLYLDHELRITRGNRGTVNVVKRLPQKVIHV